MTGKIRVIVAEGQDDERQPSGLLRAVLEQQGVEIAGEVRSHHELIQLAADEQPSAVVFADEAPVHVLDHLRTVSPPTKIIFVSSIVTAAEAEMATAVVERGDVLRSLGPILVLLCAPGRATARRGITESFDRPDWVDRIRKDTATLRGILGASQPPREERPSITRLQGHVRATDRGAPEPIVVIQDLDDGDQVEEAGAPPDREPGSLAARAWVAVSMATAIIAFAIGAAHLPGQAVRALGPRPAPTTSDGPGRSEAAHGGSRDGKDPIAKGAMASTSIAAAGTLGARATAPGDDGPGDPAGGVDPSPDPGTDPTPDPGPGGDPDPGPTDVPPGDSSLHNPHGGPPGWSDPPAEGSPQP